MALDIEGQTLKISTQSTAEEEEKEAGSGPPDTQWHRVERSCQYASRALRFPENADMSQARARARVSARERARVHREALLRARIVAPTSARALMQASARAAAAVARAAGR